MHLGRKRLRNRVRARNRVRTRISSEFQNLGLGWESVQSRNHLWNSVDLVILDRNQFSGQNQFSGVCLVEPLLPSDSFICFDTENELK